MTPSNPRDPDQTSPQATTASHATNDRPTAQPQTSGSQAATRNQPAAQSRQPSQQQQSQQATQSGQWDQSAQQAQQSQRTGQPPQSQQAPGTRQSPYSNRGTQYATPGLPAGIKAVAVTLGLLGSTSLLAGLSLGNAGATASSYGATGAGTALGGVGIIFAVLGVCEFLSAVGLWTRRRWGWQLGVGVLGLGALGSLVLLVSGSPPMGLAGLALHGGLGWYLYSQRGYYRRA